MAKIRIDSFLWQEYYARIHAQNLTSRVIPKRIEGFVIFEVYFPNPIPANIPFDPLDVAGIYTYRAEPAGTDAVAIDLTVYPAKSNRYIIPLVVPADPVVIGPANSTGKQ